MTLRIPAVLAVLASTPAPAADDLELGAYLAAECTSCHAPGAGPRGIPDITGIPRVAFVQMMEQYRSGARINEIMRNVARSLSDEEVAALAAYLEQAPGSR